MTVRLLPGCAALLCTRNWVGVALKVAPNFVRNRGAARWHRPRSGWRFPDGRKSYAYWCGNSIGDVGAESIQPEDMRCATCERRHQGDARMRS